MSHFTAELVRMTTDEIDIKVINGDRMHVLQWRRRVFWDDVLLDGKLQARSTGLWGREKVYGLIFGRDETGEGGERVMLIVDPRNSDRWTGMGDTVNGSLDPKNLEKPSTFSDWMKKQMGMEW